MTYTGPIIDSHLHLWDACQPFRPPWIAEYPALHRTFDLADYRAATGSANIAGMVFVECEVGPQNALAETAWASRQADPGAGIQAIVAWAPIEHGAAVRADLETLQQFPLVKGVRRLLQFEPAQGFCTRPEFIAGLKILPDFGYCFDICIAASQLPDTLDMVARCPATAFVLDHIGKPRIRERALEPWKRHIRALAACDNVVCKLSGLITEAAPGRWTRADLAPYIDHVLECFTPARILFGGDWPVVNLAGTFRQWRETLDVALGALSASEQADIYYHTARRTYGL